MRRDGTFHLPDEPVHLGRGVTTTPQEPFDNSMAWYDRYIERNAADGVEGRLVSLFTFDSPWEMWEMHPSGEELVVCTAGSITLHQELDGDTRTVTLEPGDAVVNPPGAWHTADVDTAATALFITPGLGTTHRPR